MLTQPNPLPFTVVQPSRKCRYISTVQTCRRLYVGLASSLLLALQPAVAHVFYQKYEYQHRWKYAPGCDTSGCTQDPFNLLFQLVQYVHAQKHIFRKTYFPLLQPTPSTRFFSARFLQYIYICREVIQYIFLYMKRHRAQPVSFHYLGCHNNLLLFRTPSTPTYCLP